MLYGASGATRKGKDALIKSSKYEYSQINWTMCKYANENIKSNLWMGHTPYIFCSCRPTEGWQMARGGDVHNPGLKIQNTNVLKHAKENGSYIVPLYYLCTGGRGEKGDVGQRSTSLKLHIVIVLLTINSNLNEE